MTAARIALDEDAGGTWRHRAFVLGYIDAAALPGEGAADAAQAGLRAYALAHDFQLGSVYVDHIGAAEAMFRALMASIERYSAAYVLVPAMEHVAPLGRPGAQTKLQQIETKTSTTMRVADGP